MERTRNQSQSRALGSPSTPPPTQLLRVTESSSLQDQEEGPMAERLTHTPAWHPKVCLATWLLTSTLCLAQKDLPF